jgi:MFS family permease
LTRRGRATWSRGRLGWPLLLLHALLIQAVAFSLRPAATYKALEQGMSPTLLGLMSAAYAFAPLLLAVPVGRLIDRRGERLPLVGGALLLTAAAALMWLAPDGWAWLVLSLAAFGVAHLICVVGEQSIVGGLSGSSTGRERSDSTRLFSTYTLVTSLGQATGPLLLATGGAGAQQPDLTVVLAVTTALALFAAVLSPFLGARRTETEAAPPARSSWQLLRVPRLRAAVIISGIVMAVVDILLVYLPALASERGYSAAFVGAVLSTRALASMAVRTLAPRLVARAGRTITLGTGVAIAASGLVLLVVAAWPGAMVAAAILVGAGLGLSQPLTMSMVSDLAPTGSRALAMSLRISGNRLGVLVLPAGIGLVFGGAGAAGVLAASAGALGWAFAVTVRHPDSESS